MAAIDKVNNLIIFVNFSILDSCPFNYFEAAEATMCCCLLKGNANYFTRAYKRITTSSELQTRSDYHCIVIRWHFCFE